MCKWPPVYIKYTHLSLSYWLCVFQVYNRWCVCMEEGWRNSRRYVRLDIIQRNLRRKCEMRNLRQISCMKCGITCMYMYHLFQTDILSLKKREACRYCHFAFATFLFRFFSRPFWEMKKV